MHVRFQTDAEDLVVGDAIMVEINLAEAEHSIVIKGSVIRGGREISVLRMEGRVHDTRLVPFTALDFLQLKAVLLNVRTRADWGTG